MKRFIIFALIFLLKFSNNLSCHIKFDKIDTLNVYHYVYERRVFNITGQLQNCPSSILVKNISILNPLIKRLSILNVSYIIEKNYLNITTFSRLIGFAPIKIEFYFQDQIEHK